MATGGYGRGGRGAALLQALKETARRPGEEEEKKQSPPRAPEPVSTTSPAAPPKPVAMPGRGRGAYLTSLREASKATSTSTSHLSSTESLSSATGGRGVAGLGRGMAALQLGGRGVQSMVSPSSTASASPAQKPPSPRHDDTVQVVHVEGRSSVRAQGSYGRPVTLGANAVNILPRNKGIAIYQYAVKFSPQVDSKNMRFRLVNEQRPMIGNVKAFDGSILFLPIALPHRQVTIQSKKPTDGSPVTITITLTKTLSPGADECMQVYNVIFRRMMACLKLVQINRNHYDPKGSTLVPQHKLEVWPGYVTAIAEHEGGLMLVLDVSHRVLRSLTVLDLIVDMATQGRRMSHDDILKAVVGCTVLTRYNNKTYRIDDVAWDQNPTCTFVSSSTGQEMSYKEYYLKNYNKNITDDQQPLLIHRPKIRKDAQSQAQGGRQRAEIICLIPELCYLTGLTDEMRADFRVMKDLAAHTRVAPQARQRELQGFISRVKETPDAIKQLEDWGLELQQTTINVDGRQLPPERILFGKNREAAGTIEADWGRDLGRNPVISGVDLNNWFVLVTQRDKEKAAAFIDCMRQSCRNMGFSVRDPKVFPLANDKTETYLRTIRDQLNPTVQMVVTIFPTSRDDRYSAVKKLCCLERVVPSQAINARTISQQQKLRSVTQKIALQINCKLGGELWAVDIPLKNVMIVGIDVYHDAAKKGRSVGGFVASMNNMITRWYSRVCLQDPQQELIDGLKVCLLAALKKFHEINHVLPDRIIIYRDGVGDGQLKTVAGYEVQQLSECFKSFGSYQPQLAVVIVQKRINTRIWGMNGRELVNPPPGTIVDSTITRRDWYDFFLISQHVRQGTVSPTHYIVVHDATTLKVDQMQRLSYKMTHLYYNWPGTVRVPAPCQYAHKLAYLIGQNVHKEHNLQLADRLFFL